jgi:hypothetical protein
VMFFFPALALIWKPEQTCGLIFVLGAMTRQKMSEEGWFDGTEKHTAARAAETMLH